MFEAAPWHSPAECQKLKLQTLHRLESLHALWISERPLCWFNELECVCILPNANTNHTYSTCSTFVYSTWYMLGWPLEIMWRKKGKKEREKKRSSKNRRWWDWSRLLSPKAFFFGCKKASYFLATLLCTHWSLERMHEHFQEWFCHIGWERAAQETCGLSPLRHCCLPKRRENVF